MRTLEGHTDLVRTLRVDEERGILVSGGYDHSTKVWNLGTGECLLTHEGHESLVFDVAFSVDKIVRYVFFFLLFLFFGSRFS